MIYRLSETCFQNNKTNVIVFESQLKTQSTKSSIQNEEYIKQTL